MGKIVHRSSSSEFDDIERLGQFDFIVVKGCKWLYNGDSSSGSKEIHDSRRFRRSVEDIEAFRSRSFPFEESNIFERIRRILYNACFPPLFFFLNLKEEEKSMGKLKLRRNYRSIEISSLVWRILDSFFFFFLVCC